MTADLRFRGVSCFRRTRSLRWHEMSQSTNREAGRGSLKVRRLPVVFTSDIRRVITRFFDPGGESRIRAIVERIAALSGGQVDRLLDEVLAEVPRPPRQHRLRARRELPHSHGNDRHDGRPPGPSPPADRVLLDRGVFDRVGGALQPVYRPASQPAQPSRRRGAVHYESPGHGRGARVVDRLPHRGNHFRSPDPNRPLRTPRQAGPRRSRQAIRQALVSPQAQRHRRR